MVYETNDRVSDALTSLVELFLPPDPDKDEEEANDRRDDVHDILESIIEENAFRLTRPCITEANSPAGTVKQQ